jgi:hypothetical protein
MTMCVPSVANLVFTQQQQSPPALMDVDDDLITRYLQYECSYRACKYRGSDVKTWGELIKCDRPHFVYLITSEVSVESNTFLALSTFLNPAELSLAQTFVRRRDTPEGKQERCNDFLRLKCTHKGRMGGKEWGVVRATDYSYFVWAVGNTMGRETKSFAVFCECLNPVELNLVLSCAKGQVKVPKGLVFRQ